MPDDTLTQPTGLRAEVDDDRTVQLTWKASPGAEAYEVHEMLKDPDDTFKQRVTDTSRSKKMKVGKYRYGVKAVAGDERSAMSTLVDVAVPAGGSTPIDTEEHGPSGPLPSTLIKLERWYLTLPVGEPGEDPEKAWNVYQNDGDLLEFSNKHFRVRDGAVEYTAPVKGAHTPGSEATRSELREMTGSGRNDKAKWTLGEDTTHSLTCTLTCDPTSITGGSKPRRECIVGQVHARTGTPPIYLAVNMKNDPGILELWLDFEDGAIPLLTGLGPDTRFSYRIESKDGKCRVWAAKGGVADLGEPKKTIPVSDFRSTTECYFKAGAYNKTEIKKGDEGASVVRHFLLELK